MSTRKDGFQDADVPLLLKRRPLHDLEPVALADPAHLNSDSTHRRSSTLWTGSFRMASLSSTLPLNTCITPFHANQTLATSTPESWKNPSQILSEQKRRPFLTTDFALSALKNSFSMSSLSHNCNIVGTTPSPVHTPEPLRVKWERPFNSLTRPRDRTGAKALWRRSWGSSPLASKEDVTSGQGQTEYWPALQANYAYLMDCDLIECCKSLHGELSWDNGDLEPLHFNRSRASVNQSFTCAVGCQTDAEIATPDLHFQLQLLRQWLKEMEKRVPKLILKPKWTREILEQRIKEHKVLQREIESRSAEFVAVGRRCQSWNRRVGRALESRYHRLLLRILEWSFHLETLAKKPPEFWSGRRTAASSPESEVELLAKYPRLEYEEDPIHQEPQGAEAATMRQQIVEGGSPVLPKTGSSRRNIASYEFTHTDTDTEKSTQKDKAIGETLTHLRVGADKEKNITLVIKSNDSSDNEWVYSSCHNNGESPAEDILSNVRKKLSFDSEEETSSTKSWYRYSSSDSDWLHSGDVALDASEEEHSDGGTEENPIHSQDSVANDTVRVYGKEDLQRLVTQAEQLVAEQNIGNRGKMMKPGLRYSKEEVNSECDASSELTSGDSEPEAEEGSDSLRCSVRNRTFVVPETVKCESPLVIMRGRKNKKAQRPWSLTGMPEASNSHQPFGPLSASETALNHLPSPVLPFPKAKPIMCNVSTQKDLSSPSVEGLGTSLTVLSSSGSASGGARRRRRHSSRRRNLVNRRELDVQSASSDNNLTLKNRFSASASSSSSSSSSESSNSSLQNRNVARSSTLTYLGPSAEELLEDKGLSPKENNGSTPPQSKEMVFRNTPYPGSTLSTPRSAPSDGEVLVHADETSNFSEQAWDNYLDRYASEAYSEDADADAARRLLDFGDDYRNYLDSQSDCPSSFGTDSHGLKPHTFKRSPFKRSKMANRSLMTTSFLDSDSDVDDFRHLLETSTSQLHVTVNTLNKFSQLPHWEPAQSAELLATCRTNVECLQTVLVELEKTENDFDSTLSSLDEIKVVRDLIVKWEAVGSTLTAHQEKMSQQRELQQQLIALKSKLRDRNALLNTVPDDDLEESLQTVRCLLTQLDADREALLTTNLAVHSFLADAKENDTVTATLKEDVTELYQLWQELFDRVKLREKDLEEATQTWVQFQRQLSDLRAGIAADQQKLQHYLEQRCSNVDSSSQTAALLSSDPSQNSQWSEDWVRSRSSMQCDSGISSGSDGEFISLSEREKRLSSLRQLARRLEAALVPGNAALKNVNLSLCKTEEDLRNLESRLRNLNPNLVARDSGSKQVPLKESSVQTDPLIRRRRRRLQVQMKKSLIPLWWRIVRLGLPIQLTLLTLLCAACIMEPSCCNYVNNFGTSMVPKLNYMGGPPPI